VQVGPRPAVAPSPIQLFVEHHRLRLTDAIFVCDLGPGPRVGAIGPSRYCAPEQLYGRWRDCGPWTDLYGVGGLIRRLITGHDPEGHRSEQAQPPVYSPKFAVPEGLSAWIQSLLAERVDDRPHSTAEAMASLRELEPNVPLLNPPPRVSHLITAPWSEGKRWVWPQVNRTVEHDVALAWVDRQLSRATQPAALVISGDEAQGRSTLLGDLRARIHHQTGITVLQARCDERHGYAGPLAELMLQWFRCHGMSRSEAFERVRRATEPQPEPSPATAPVFEPFPGPDAASMARDQQAAAWVEIMIPGGTGPERSKVQKVRFARPVERFAVGCRFLATVAQAGPVLVVLDDLHACRETTGWAAHALQQVSFAHPVLVMATVDPHADGYTGAALQSLLRVSAVETLPLRPIASATLCRKLGVDPAWCLGEPSPLGLALSVPAAIRRGELESVPGEGLKPTAVHVRVTLGGGVAEGCQQALDTVLKALPEAQRSSAQLALELAAVLGDPVRDAELEEACAFRGVTPGGV
ncbi:MAG: AAA family ATPase, partial [Myxococcota bacterium]